MSNKLKKLTASALAIPGMVTTANAAGPAESEASYRYTYYNEDDSPAARDDSGSSQPRYTIQVHQFHLLMPLKDKYSVTVESSFETMSGASPVYSFIKEGDDRVFTHFSGASKENRFDLSLGGRRYFSKAEYGVGTYFSIERDYIAFSGSADGSFQINDQMTTLSGGVSAGWDKMDPTTLREPGSEDQQINEPGRYAAIDKTKWQISAFEGVGQIINMNTVVQATGSFTYKSGYLSDPYRECNLTSSHAEGVPCDLRPSSRSMGTLSAGARHFLPQLNAAVHADFRWFVDSWDVSSSTIDLDYHQNWAPGGAFFSSNGVNFRVSPGFRYYIQSNAFFYDIPDLNNGDKYTEDTLEYYSSDPRLSKYGAMAVKLRLKADFRAFSWVGYAERYAANPSFGLNFDEDVPGLPAFWRLSTGLDYRF